MITPQQDNYIVRNNKASNGWKSFLFDFNKGDFNVADGKLQEINNLEALKLWIEKVLKTTKYKFAIYEGVDYGITDLKELITSGLPLQFIQAEMEREVKETLIKNSNIKSVQNFKFERNKRLLNVSFDCITVYGTVDSEVIF
ncbi:DUF2634 domain-containing protein [Clostridium botulinum]|uniref:DUF2634 domain-containing protein n=1 Tax=Clostridium botulinum TaxID=1491 RepID=UPI001967C491|nr:DUF2634 domain-containing protein [Clostridium botulinum]MBN1079262.1 DUF2634 domain-containing protein [Clostridium botulinum]